MNDPRTTNGASGVRALPLAIAGVMILAGARLLLPATDTAVSAGVLLIIAGLGAAGVAVGSGTAAEGALDLSSRIGLGMLGGLLAGVVLALLTEMVGWLGIASVLGIGLETDLSSTTWLDRALMGAAAGIALGVTWRLLPGRGSASRGMALGMVLAAWQLFFVFPFQLGLGFAGIEAGLAVAPLIIVGLGIAGAVAGSVVGWAENTELAPVSAPLVP